MAKVTAPNKEYTGLSAGVSFVNGVGETDNPHLLEWFQERGYQVEESKQPEATPIKKMKVEELKEHAAKNGIDLGEASKKEEILAVIKGAAQTPPVE